MICIFGPSACRRPRWSRHGTEWCWSWKPMTACQGETNSVSLGDERGHSGALESSLLQWYHGSLFRKEWHLSDWSHCWEDALVLPCTTVAIRLARIWKLHRTCASNLRTRARTASFRHRERRISGIPGPNVSSEYLTLPYTRVSAVIATMKS